ncbi:MAG: hypothetical protein QOG62_1586 [Thermoleophilaceae bacterium]|jgi:hypothetical protein|nr:hypothetical protein [Thermoleophilaceae bacterium]
MQRLRNISIAVPVWLLLTAAPALAHDNGQGLLGETTDREVTFFCLGVIIFIAALVTVLSLIQHKLEKRHGDHQALPERAGW